jgi:hypothetical protein
MVVFIIFDTVINTDNKLVKEPTTFFGSIVTDGELKLMTNTDTDKWAHFEAHQQVSSHFSNMSNYIEICCT